MQAFRLLAVLMLFAINSLSAQKQELIEASLKDIRNPKILDSLAQELLAFSDDSITLGRAHFLKGMAGTYSARPDIAAENFAKSLSYLEPGIQYDERFSYEVVLKNLGIAYYRIRKFEKGDSSFVLLRDLALKKEDSLQYALALKAMANSQMVRQNLDSAATLMKESTLILQRLDYRGISSSYLSLGSIYGRIYQEEKALKWFAKALRYSDLLPDKRMKGRVYNNMAVAHRALANYDSANFYLKQAIALFEAMASPRDQVEAYANLTRNFSKLEQWDSADYYLNRAWRLLPSAGRSTGKTRLNLWILSLSKANAQEDVAEGALYLDSIRSEVKRELIIKDVDILDAFAGHYELSGNSDSAISYLRMSKERNQELEEQRNAARIKAAANKLEIAELKNQQNEELKSYQLAILAVLSFGFFGVLWFWKSRRAIKKAAAENEIERAKVEEGFSLINDHKKEILSGTESNDQLKLKSKAIINISKLNYLESDGHYVNLYLEGRKNPEVERSSLKAMEDQLKDHDFVRIHRSYLVNASRLKAVYATKVLLEDGSELPLSRTYKEELKQRFNPE